MTDRVADPARRAATARLLGGGLALLTSAGLLTGLAPRPAAARSLRVASTADLGNALATPGVDLIELAPGDYGPLRAKGVGGAAKAPLVIRSADPGKPARLTGITLDEPHDVTFEALTVAYKFSAKDKRSASPFTVQGGRNLVFNGVSFQGERARGVSPEVDGFGYGQGPLLQGIVGLTIANCEFSVLFKGLSVHDSSSVRIIGNNIHGMRSEGMNLSQIDGLEIARNWIHDFDRAVASADHADMIQIWTTNTTRPTRNVEIHDNVLNSGLGAFTHSIFMANDRVSKGLAGAELYFQNITIKNNVIVNAHTNAIFIGASNGLTIENNSLIHNRRSDGPRNMPPLYRPQIRIAAESRKVTIRRNVTFRINGYKKQAGWTVADNYLVQDLDRLKPGFYDQVFVNAVEGDPRDLASFAYRKGGPLYRAGIGAPLLDSQP